MAQHKNPFAKPESQKTPEQIASEIPELETDVHRIAAREAAKPKQAPESHHMTGMDAARLAAATGLRIGGQWAGTTLGGVAGGLAGGVATAPIGAVEGAVPGAAVGASVGGGLGGALGEYLAQKVEPHGDNPDPKVNLGRVAVAGGTGAIPMGWLIKAGKPALTALRGAAVGYGGVAGNKLADGKSAEESLNPLEWSRAEQVMGPGLGAGVGALFSRYHAPAKDVTAGPIIDKATEEARLLEGVNQLKKEPVRPGVAELPHYKGLRVGPKEGGEFPPDVVTGKDTPEMTAMREALEKHTLENPTGDVAKAIYGPGGRPNVKDGKNVIPSVTEMETMHGAGLDYAKAQDKAHFGAIEKTKRELTAEFNKHLNGKNAAMDKAQREIEKAGTQETRNLNARTKYVTNGLIQDTRNENAVNKFERNMGSAVEGAAKEDAKRTADAVADANAQHQQSVIDERIAERPVVNKDAPVREHFNGIGPDGGEARTHTIYSLPEPEENEADFGGGGSSGGGPHTPPKDLGFWNLSEAEEYARKRGMSPSQWKITGKRGEGFKFVKVGEAANPVDANIIPDEPGQLIGRAAGDGVAVPDEITEDMRKMHGKLFSKKSDAEAFRDAYPGSEIKQYGQKGKYRLEFPAINAEESRLAEEARTAKLAELEGKVPPPVDLPRSGGSELGGAEGSVAPYDPNAVVDGLRGGLSREEFQRLKGISTGRFSDASKLTPELQAERAALEAKQRMPQVEVSDYTGGQPEHTIDAAIPDGSEPPVGDDGYPSDWDNIDPEPPAPVPTPKGPKGPKPTPAQKFQARAEALADKQPPVDIAPPVEDAAAPPVVTPKPTPKGTGKSAKLAETNNGLDVLQSLADDVHGGELPQDLNPISNGQLPAEPYVNPVGEAEQVLPGIEPTVNPDAAPVAEAPFTLVGKPGPKFNPQQSSMLEEPMDGQSVINRAVKREQAKPENVAKVAKLRAQAQSMFDESMARVNPPPEPTGITVDPGPQPLPEKLPSEEPPSLDLGGPEPTPVPVEPTPKSGPGGAFPARLFKSRLEAAGENYGAVKNAKKAGEAVPEEGRRIAAAGAQQETNNFADELASGTRPVDDIESLPEQSRKIMWDRLKQSLAKANPKNERGALETQLMLRMGLGGAGAAAGAVANDDDPLTGAVMGGAAGAALPSLGKGLGKIDWSALGKRLPDIQRAFYLSEPNGLAANTIGAPMGLGGTTAIEKMLEGKFSGNPALVKQGTNLFKGLRTIPSRMRDSVNEAGNMLASSPDNISESLPFQTENNKVFKYMKLPATYITAAHLALRDVARDAGVPVKEAVNIALGNEPGEALAAENWMSSHIRALGQGMQNLKSTRVENPGSPEKTKNIIANIIAPFTRTASNVAASTPMKVPGLGLLLKAGGAPESWASVGSQQVLGSGIAAGSYALGANVDPDTAKIVRKWVRNISGKYGLVATTAFEAGQASQTGKKTAGNVLFNGISEGVPMPTMEVPKDWWNFGQSVIDGNPQVPQSAIPGVIRTLMDTAEVGTPKNKSHKKAF